MNFTRTRVIRHFGTESAAPPIDPRVEELGSGSFARGLFSIFALPDTSRVRIIGKDAFYRCEWLALVIIPSSVEVVGEGAFHYCEALQEVRIARGSRLRLIEKEAFEMCDYLGSIDVPSSAEIQAVVKILARVYDEDGCERVRVQFITMELRG
jgi:hypothetical protein